MPSSISSDHVRAYHAAGYTVVPGLFARDECQRYIDHYMDLRLSGAYPDDHQAADPTAGDPLLKYPRMIHMHRWDPTSRAWLLDERIRQCLSALLAREPFAVQTMLYFKPPGARGQAVHQDNYYLLAAPGTCVAAWMPLDDCNEANGCLQVVPGSSNLPLMCTRQADTTLSSTNTEVEVPPGMPVVDVAMQAGDVLFFHGSLLHGSTPNRTRDRFRRTIVGHYITGDASRVAAYYQPVLRFDGSEFKLEANQRGGPCGVWVDRDGKPMPELVGEFAKRLDPSENAAVP